MKFKDFDKNIIKNNVQYAVGKITEIIKDIGPRESASVEAFQAMELLRKDLDKYADETHYETYKMAPRAFQHFTKTISIATIGAIGAGSILKYTGAEKLGKLGKIAKNSAVPHAIISGVSLASLGITALEFLLYKQFTDVLYPKVTGRNLIATRKATEETKKRIVINGHIDSAHELRHTYYGKGKGMTPIMAGSIASSIATAVISAVSVTKNSTVQSGDVLCVIG